MAPEDRERLAAEITRHEDWLRKGKVGEGRADFTGRNLHGGDFRNRDLSGACFYRAELAEALLAAAVFHGANFDSADLSRSNSKGTDFSHASLHRTNLQGADLQQARFQDAILFGADLRNSDCQWTNFEGADLRSALLLDSRLHGARLAGANLIWTDTVASTTWFRRFLIYVGATPGPYRLDANFCAGTLFPTNAVDPWSILRRTYTGSRYFILLLLTVSALLPWLARALAWSTLHELEFSALEVLQRSEQVHVETVERVLQEYRTRLGAPKEGWSVLALLFEAHRGAGLVVLNMLLFAYYCIRGTLTISISRLRDEEDRTGVSPSWNAYRRWWSAHRYLVWTTPIVLLILMVRLAALLGETVYLPFVSP